MARRAIAATTLVSLLAGGCRVHRVAPPRSEFLVAAGDSTVWVRSGAQGIRARGSPLRLARYGGRFYEVYVADDDRSYADAEIVGQQVWRRDIISGDSALVFRDTTIDGIERWYARTHPDDRPLGPDEDLNDNPTVSATSEFDVLDAFGPYVSYEYRADLSVTGGEEWHLARHGVLDLRGGHDATLVSLFGARQAHRIHQRGRVLFGQALDSVLASKDARARAAASAIGDFVFDGTSFSLAQRDGAPVVTFAAPGRGSRGGGLLLPLPPIPAPEPVWWDTVRAELPTGHDSAGIFWTHHGYRVVAGAASDSDADRLTLVDSTGRSWRVGVVPAPTRSIFWLDSSTVDSITIRALGRAFDEAALYSEEARTAMIDPSTPSPAIPDRPARPVRASQHETSEIMMPQHANVLGHVFGGVILSMMDRAAAVAAIRHARGNCVTVSVDRVDFREPIHVGDLVVMKSSVNYAGRTSMEVGVRVEAEDILRGTRRHTNSCYLTFVAIDENGRPVPVPVVVPENDVEKRRYDAAIERRRRRLEERTAEERRATSE